MTRTAVTIRRTIAAALGLGWSVARSALSRVFCLLVDLYRALDSGTAVEIVYEGTPAGLNTRALTQAALSGLLKPALSEVNMVNAPLVAKERGVRISEVRRDQQGAYEGYIKLTIFTPTTMTSAARAASGMCSSSPASSPAHSSTQTPCSTVARRVRAPAATFAEPRIAPPATGSPPSRPEATLDAP